MKKLQLLIMLSLSIFVLSGCGGGGSSSNSPQSSPEATSEDDLSNSYFDESYDPEMVVAYKTPVEDKPSTWEGYVKNQYILDPYY